MNITDKHGLEEIIGYKFKDESLLKRALTHSSYANEHKAEGGDNERLEFLGDSVLSVITAEYLYTTYTLAREGYLTRLRALVVCEKALGEYAAKIELGKYINFNSGEEATGGRQRASVTSDAFEALLGAIFLDGGIEEAKRFVLPFLIEEIKRVENSTDDYKSALQELIQKNKGSKIEYVLTGESGPDHDKQFTTQLYVNGQLLGTGTAGSKKASEQAAAKQALEKYKNEK